MTEFEKYRNRIWIDYHLYKDVVETVVRETIRRQPGDTDWRKHKAILLTYRLKDEDLLQVLFWAPTNYIAVMSRRFPDPPGPVRFDMAGWRLDGYHDSCWTDSFDRVLWPVWEEIESSSFGLEFLWLCEAQQDELREFLKTNRR